jgi:hypothetical protein
MQSSISTTRVPTIETSPHTRPVPSTGCSPNSRAHRAIAGEVHRRMQHGLSERYFATTPTATDRFQPTVPAHELTAHVFEVVFGSRWRQVFALARTLDVESDLLETAPETVSAAWWCAPRWREATHAAHTAACIDNRRHELTATMNLLGVLGRGAARVAARDAGRGLVARDLVGSEFTQEHYDYLTGPWRRNVGPVHPGDRRLGEDMAAANSQRL